MMYEYFKARFPEAVDRVIEKTEILKGSAAQSRLG